MSGCNYLQEAKNTINAIKTNIVKQNSRTYLDSSNQQFLNTMWNYVSVRDGGYYDGAIQILSMLVISGNWFQP